MRCSFNHFELLIPRGVVQLPNTHQRKSTTGFWWHQEPGPDFSSQAQAPRLSSSSTHPRTFAEAATLMDDAGHASIAFTASITSTASTALPIRFLLRLHHLHCQHCLSATSTTCTASHHLHQWFVVGSSPTQTKASSSRSLQAGIATER